jgi:malonate transporter
MHLASLVFPIFAVIVTGWLAGALGYLPRSLAAPLVQFAYNVAMPALVFLTIAQEQLRGLLDWGFLAAFGGGSVICFAVVILVAHLGLGRNLASSTMIGTVAAMTNTGFVALPILQALYGPRGILPAAIATVVIAVVLRPASIVLLESSARGKKPPQASLLIRHIVFNPVMISTLLGLAWSVVGVPVPQPIAAYTGIFGEALTPCALFAIGLGLTLDELRGDIKPAAVLSVVKLLVTPLIVYGLCLLCGLSQFSTIAAVVCAAVPTAKTAYILSGEYHVEESLTASTISLTTLLSVPTLLAWLYLLN